MLAARRASPRRAGWVQGLSIEEKLEQLQQRAQEQEQRAREHAQRIEEQEQRVREQARRLREHEQEMAALRQEREKDNEVVRCLMDLMEDTVPTADVHAMVARVTDQIGESSAAWRSALSAVEAKLETVAGSVQPLDGKQHAASPREHLVPLQKLETSIHDIERRLETASGNIAEINIRLLGKGHTNDSKTTAHPTMSAMDEKLRGMEVSIERAAMLWESQLESMCRRELALARMQWEQEANERDGSVAAQSHADHARLQQRIDECALRHEQLAQQVLAQRADLASLKQSSALAEAKAEALATGLATVSAHKSGREDAQAAEHSSLRDALEQLERCAILRRPAKLGPAPDPSL